MEKLEVVARDGDLSIRRMRDVGDDYRQMLAWRCEPHIRAIWDADDQPEHTLATIRAEYEPITHPDSVSIGTFIELGGRPIGHLEFYRWADFADAALEMSIPPDEGAWGLDIFVGDPDELERGYGSRAVDLTCRYLFEIRGAKLVALLTAVDNVRAQRAYEKAGMYKRGRALDTDVRGGKRVECWLMVRDTG